MRTWLFSYSFAFSAPKQAEVLFLHVKMSLVYLNNKGTCKISTTSLHIVANHTCHWKSTSNAAWQAFPFLAKCSYSRKLSIKSLCCSMHKRPRPMHWILCTTRWDTQLTEGICVALAKIWGSPHFGLSYWAHTTNKDFFPACGQNISTADKAEAMHLTSVCQLGTSANHFRSNCLFSSCLNSLFTLWSYSPW